MNYNYKTVNTCSNRITFDLNGDIVTNIEFLGGCEGNLKAITQLVEGMTVDEITKKLGGIKCGRRPTSCADQLSLAIKQAYEREKEST